MWAERNRDTSLDNRRDCDEIMRQFLDIDFNESMLFTSTDTDKYDIQN